MDRLYVQLPDGLKLGYWDLATGQPYPTQPAHLPVLQAALARWQLGNGGTFAPPPVEPPAPATTAPQMTEPIWQDLTGNRAGAEARKQAEAKRAAAPVLTFIARMLDVKTEERAWRIGAQGEELVGEQLSKLVRRDPRWMFLHAVPVGERGSDIDHIVIGPGGIFTLNAKHHPQAKIWVSSKTLLVNGNRQWQYVRNSQFEAKRASELLSRVCEFPVPVEALIVPVNAAEVTIKSQPEGVTVVPRKQLVGWLLNQPELHAPHVVARVHEFARRSTTWHV